MHASTLSQSAFAPASSTATFGRMEDSFSSLRHANFSSPLVMGMASFETETSIVVHPEHISPSPPSPAPLLCVSVSLFQAGLVQSPAQDGGRRETGTVVPSYGRTACLVHDALTAVAEGKPEYDTAFCPELNTTKQVAELTTDDDAFDVTSTLHSLAGSASGTSSTASAVARTAAWHVFWWHLIPAHVCGYLTVRDIVTLSMVCRTGCAAMQQPWIWRTLAWHHHHISPAAVEQIFRDAVEEGEEGTIIGAERASQLQVHDAHPYTLQDSAAELPSVTTSVLHEHLTWLVRAQVSESAMSDAVRVSNSAHDDSHSMDAVILDTVEEALERQRANSAAHARHLTGTEDLQMPSRATVSVRLSQADASESYVVAAIASPRPGMAHVQLEAARSSPLTHTAPTCLTLSDGRARYLWQTTAAAMPSPSSPVSTPYPEEPLLPTRAVPAEERSTSELSMASSASTSSEVSFAAETPSVTDSTESTHIPARGATATAVVTVGTAASGDHLFQGKGSSAWRRAQLDRLPPPTPAQLGATSRATSVSPTTATLTSSTAPQEETVEGAVPLRRLHGRHFSCVLAEATDVTVTDIESAAYSAAMAPHSSSSSLAVEPEYEGGEEGDDDGASTGAFPDAAATTSAAVAYTNTLLDTATTDLSAAPRPEPASLRYGFTLCRVTAERTVLRRRLSFPWAAFTRFLHSHCVLTRLATAQLLSRRAREELCRGSWEAAYGSLSCLIHMLCQTGACVQVEQLTHLARGLVRRGTLCRHRGHVHLTAAATDLGTAALLCPEMVSTQDLAGLCARDEGMGTMAATSCTCALSAWLKMYEHAATIASPVAVLGAIAQLPYVVPQSRHVRFGAALLAYMGVRRLLGQHLAHLLNRAAACAAPGTEEELLVRALREAAAIGHTSPSAKFTATSSQCAAACGVADYAVSFVPLPVRQAVEQLCAAWTRDCLEARASLQVLEQWPTSAPEAIAFSRSTPLEVRWVAWLTMEVHLFVHQEMTGQLPAQSALASLVLAHTNVDRASAAVRVAAFYADPAIRSAEVIPSLPPGTSRQGLARNLLLYVERLHPLHVPAAVLLARLCRGEAEEAEAQTVSFGVLTACIHRWAQPSSLIQMPARLSSAAESLGTSSYLHRRDRRPEVCFIPAELLVERNGLLYAVADLAEATEQHPTLSYPYQMRAAIAMDRGYHLAAVHELGRIVDLTMNANDVALHIRFLRDALEMAAAAGTSSPPLLLPALPASAPITHVAVSTTASSSFTESGSPVVAAEDNQRGVQPAAVPLYQACLKKLCGLLAFLHAPSAQLPLEGYSGSLATMTRELPSISLGDIGEGHVSRVVSMAFGEQEPDESLLGLTADAVEAAHVRAFLLELTRGSTDASTAALPVWN